MHGLARMVADLIGPGLAATDPAEVTAAFHAALRPFGLQAVYARDYRRAAVPGRPARVFARLAPAGLDAMYADRRFYDHNPIPRGARDRIHPVLWSELRWAGKAQHWIRGAMRDCGCPDGIAIPCHGPGSFGLMSLSFERLGAIAPAERRAVEVAGLVIYDHLRRITLQDDDAPDAHPALTRREQDCLAFIAEGRSDAGIAEAMNLSPATVATHIVNARTKLGARTRSQAVALFLCAEHTAPRRKPPGRH